jgi:hypothetical protein
MRLKDFITMALLSIAMGSCWEPMQVVINNKSAVDQDIHVKYPPNSRLVIDGIPHVNDTLQAYDHTLTANAISTRDYFRYPVKIAVQSLDTINRTYFIQLKAKHQVVVEARRKASALPWGQLFIMDNTDTVELRRRGGAFKKRGGSWTYVIQDTNLR